MELSGTDCDWTCTDAKNAARRGRHKHLLSFFLGINMRGLLGVPDNPKGSYKAEHGPITSLHQLADSGQYGRGPPPEGNLTFSKHAPPAL